MINIKDGAIYDGDTLIRNISECVVSDGYIHTGLESFSFENYPELKTAWDELYPNGKPVLEIPVEPQPPTEIELLREELRLNKLRTEQLETDFMAMLEA